MATIKKACKGVSYPKASSVSRRLQKGGSLGMKSVKAGYDNNPAVTRADIIVAAKKQAKKGMKVKKAQSGWSSIKDKMSKVKGFSETYGPTMDKLKKATSSETFKKTYKPLIDKVKAVKLTPKNKMGGKIKKCAYGCK